MAERIVLIEHGDDPRDDRASTHLAERGFALDWRFPFRGDPLPESLEDVAGTILYGGGQAVTEADRLPFLLEEARWAERCMAANLPTLGLCLGGQVIAHALGAAVGPHPEGLHEFGYYPLRPTAEGAALIPEGLVVAQSHYHGFDLPAGATLLAASETYPHQAFGYGARTYAVQFHPEVTRAGFRRWQDSDWAPFGKPGAQTRTEQDALGAAHDPAMHRWFTEFLDGLFAPVPA